MSVRAAKPETLAIGAFFNVAYTKKTALAIGSLTF